MAGCTLKYYCPVPNLHSRRRWLTLLTYFLLPISLVVTWLPEHNHLGGWKSIFQCSVLTPPTEVQTNIFLHNPPLFQHLFICILLWQNLENDLTILIALVWTFLLSVCVIHPATSRMTNPIKTVISPNNLFSWLFLPLQKSVKLVQDNPCYISLYMLLHMYLHILKTWTDFT